MTNKTHFGYKEVDKAQKAKLVGGVFSSVASKYDIMNDAMSIGIHRLWKDSFIAQLNPRKGSKLLDVAGGTGDIAFRFLNKTHSGNVTVCDINKDMLLEGKKRSVDRNMLQNIEWVCGDAEKLPMPKGSFDYYTIAFGIRNVTNIENALLEAYRVLKPGGRFMCLEFSQVDNPLLGKIYDVFSFRLIPKIGKFLAGDEASYRYLVESIRKFPSREGFAGMIRDAGFLNVTYKELSGGIVAIHSGWKI
jgi:demethylmenaquinone methyltransferase/2-methoxy-6-polyprenyl-1,4-benzoquinol methylase